MNNLEPTRISDKLTDSLVTLYQIGGLGLVFIFIGVLIMIFAFIFPENTFSTSMFILGSILVMINFIIFVIIQYKGLMKTKMKLNENKQIIDEIQDLAIALTNLTYNTQNNRLNNIYKIKLPDDTVMGIINPIIEEMPQQSALEKENISSNEVNYSDEIENVIKDTKEALEEGNFQIISQYSKQIEDLNKKLQIE